MKRPQSAKIGARGYWGHGSQEIDQNSSNKNIGRKQVAIMKPDLTTHDFSRILPKKIHQDKERLYSQTLQLKQSINELTEQNMRLKTKLSVIEKQKTRLAKQLESEPNRKPNSRLNLYASRASEKQNSTVLNLKKLLRESKEEVQFLRVEAQKIKKTIKYTHLNEMEIEKKMLYDENRRISEDLHRMASAVQDQQELESENKELRKYLEEEMEENKGLADKNEEYSIIVEELENKIRQHMDKAQAREKKLNRDLALEKRKNIENQRFIEDMKREINNLKASQAEKKTVQKAIIRPSSSNPNKRYPINSQQAKRVQTQNNSDKIDPKQVAEEHSKAETQEIKERNAQLQQQLKEIKSRLERSQNDNKLKERRQKQTRELPRPMRSSKQIQVQSSKQQQRAQIKIEQKPVNPLSNPTIKGVENKEQKFANTNRDEQSYNEGFEPEQTQSYSQVFEKAQSPEIKKPQIQKNRVAEVEVEFKEKASEDNQLKGKKGGKGKTAKKNGYKPDKEMLTEIKELLTYRMKSQRYPFEDLKTDIQAAITASFSYTDLLDMLINQPFYLTNNYSKALLSYFYESDNIDPMETLKCDVLIKKLRKVIEDFVLMDEEQEKEMILRITEMTCTYPQELQAAFEEIKNGEETVAKQDLIQMFKKLELEEKYIEVIIAEMSICSTDLNHLNFNGFFERFYDEEEDVEYENHAIEQQGQESEEQSHREVKNPKKHSKKSKHPAQQEEDQQDYMGKYMMAIDSRIPEKPKNFDDEDIVSDDGRI